MSRRLLPALVLLIAGCAPSAPDPDQPLTAEEVAPVAEQYATLVAANYADAHASALELRDAIANFVAAPGEAGLEAARLAWLDARESYGQTEVFRFYDGPIEIGRAHV